MSWLYVPGSEASASVSDSPSHEFVRSVTSRGKLMPLRYWQRRWKRGGWIRHLSGATLPPSTADDGVASWISSLRDSRASRGVLPANGSANRMTDGSGLRSRGSSASANPLSSSWRTSHSTLFKDPSLTWKLWVSGSRLRSVSARKTLELLTAANDGGAWLPTPSASSYGRNKGGQNPDGPERPSLETMARHGLWPTPTDRDWRSGKASKATMDRNSRPLSEVVLWATPPVCGNYNRAGSSPTSGDGLATQVGGQLNPTWVEWLMGFPIGWTSFETSETQWSRWQQLMLGSS